MPTYDYSCVRCGSRALLRRLISEFDSPADCLMCGQAMERLFTPSSNIFVPISFRAVLTGGAVGGGQLAWSDFHDHTEKELAHLKDDAGRPIELAPYNRAMSQPGVGVSKKEQRKAHEAGVEKHVERAFLTARGRMEAVSNG